MEKCVLCGREFEPLPLPELSELEFFGVKPPKPPHKAICPSCALRGASDFLKLAARILEAEEESKEIKVALRG